MPTTRPDFAWYTARATRAKELIEAAEEAYADGDLEEVVAHLEVAESDAHSLLMRLRELIKRLNEVANDSQ